MQKIGLFGGTFNPIHEGHLRLARAFGKALSLDRLIVIPDHTPPHKEAQDLANGVDRYNMCRLAVRDIPRAEVSDFEIRRDEKSYTVHTLRHFKERYPDAQLYFLMGSDMFLTVEHWYDAQSLFSLAVLCAGARLPDETEHLKRQEQRLRALGARTVVLDIEPLRASSTEVRERLRIGTVDDAVPETVRRYIRTVCPYGCEPEPIRRWKRETAARLGAKRRWHCECVAKEAATLAILYGADENKAYTAGLLHDIAKELPPAEQLQILKKSGIILDDVERREPKLWHAKAGAELSRELGINDPEIINAIRYHTTAREGITLLEQVIYLADCVSFERTYEGADAIRAQMAFGLDSALLMATSLSIAFLAKRNSPIHIDTVKAYNSFLPAE